MGREQLARLLRKGTVNNIHAEDAAVGCDTTVVIAVILVYY
jgi:hypothetical protein